MPSPVRSLLAPRLWGLHLLAAVAVTAAMLLGLWQYDAWQTRREDQAIDRADAAPRALTSVMTADNAFPGDAVGQPVELAGRWLPGATMYVADRQLDGRRGVWAVTPVAVCGGSGPSTSTACAEAPAMLVVRGWAPAVTEVPAAPTGLVQVTGWLQPGEGTGTPDPDPTDRVLPEMRIASAVQQVNRDLYGAFVIARDLSTTPTLRGAGAGLRAVTPASLPRAETFTALRNLLYAVEWWVFGGFALFLWWRFCLDETASAAGVRSST